jgi:hypothetical protein
MKTIRTFTNVAEAGFASSLLEAAGIQTLLAGEESFQMTPGLATGGIRLQVREEDEERALEVLKDGFYGAEDGPAKAGGTGGSGESRVSPGLFVSGAILLSLLVAGVRYWYVQIQAEGVPPAVQRISRDYNHDERPDHNWIYERGVLTSAEVDTNYDGRIDIWEKFDPESRPASSEHDVNFDGKVDTWYVYRQGQLESGRRDTDFDGRADWFSTYKDGVIVQDECRPNESEVVVRRILYRDGVPHEEYVDENGDGTFDYLEKMDLFGNPSRRVPLGGK